MSIPPLEACELPPTLAIREPARNRCVVLVDGEHYPEAVADAISLLQRSGWSVLGAALVGGGEKLRSTPDYGVPHWTAPDSDPGPSGALRATLAGVVGLADAVIDLADEPVLVFERRLEIIALAAGRGLRYLNADTSIEPPSFASVDAPTLAIVGTGKRIGKTAVSAHCARVLDRHLGRADGGVVVVAMGRGGPAEPVVVDRASGALTLDRLLAISRAGAHAASDYLEGAALTGLTTIGCRRVSGGLLGVPVSSNVPEGARIAAARRPELILLEGPGPCIPPVHADASLLLASTARPSDLLEGLGPYRLGLADAVLVVGDDHAVARHMCSEAVRLSGRRELRCMAVSLVPVPVGPVSGHRVAAFTTAPDFVAPLVRRQLEAAGAEVVLVSCNLARRTELVRDLESAAAAGADTLVVEIKAAAIDVVAETADRTGLDVVFLDNEPTPHVPSDSLDGLLVSLAVEAIDSAAVGGSSEI